MNFQIIIEFFKEQKLYNEELFQKIYEKTKIYDKPYEEIKDFVGCYPIYDDKDNIIDFKLILPNIRNIYDILIYIHEYSHALFLEDDSEIFPNLMEALFINRYFDTNQKIEILKRTKEQIAATDSLNHIIGKKIKIKAINL